MKISTNTISDIAKDAQLTTAIVPDGVEILSQKIGAQLGAIESIEDFGAKYAGVVIVRVVSCVDHPAADRLHVCTIDDGGTTPDVKREADGTVQVVCGAPNVREGLLVAWLPPGSTVPESVGKDPFVLGTRELRGVVSNGMLASAKELAISDSHEGILEIDEGIAAGTLFVDAFDLRDDYVLDIENKMFTHRPDCFGWLGVAREVAGIQHKSFKSPEWYTAGEPAVFEPTSTTSMPLVLDNQLSELVPRFMAVTMSDIEVKPSPIRMQLRLARHGVRPINNVVDITNYLMLETGQPMHAYDYDKVLAQDTGAKTATIAVRAPKTDETLALLNGKTVTPHKNAILIASATQAIGLGGVMGGAETEVSNETTNIILECASFDMYSIRKTAMEHGIFTDAVTRFTKGQSPLQNQYVTARAVEMLQRLAGGQVAGVYDDDHTNKDETVVRVSGAFVNERLGLQLSPAEMKTLLENVEFRVSETKGELSVVVPFWRTDIAIPEDIVEEVGRLYGYDKLPLEMPKRSAVPTEKDVALTAKSRVRDILSRAGANEVLSYSFVHGNLLAKANQSPDEAFSLSNALSPDLQYYRLSITPSLLEKVHPNIKAGHNEFALFEIGRAHALRLVDEDGFPREWTNVALVYTADTKTAKHKPGAAFFEARAYAVYLLDRLGVTYTIEPVAFELTQLNDQLDAAPFDTVRRAYIRIGAKVAGFIGEYAPTVATQFKLPPYSAGFELWFDELVRAQTDQSDYQPLSRFPSVTQDVTLKAPAETPYAELERAVRDALGTVLPDDIAHVLSAKDIYAPDNENTTHITFHITCTDHSKTLTDKEVNRYIDAVSKHVATAIGATRI